MATTFRLSEGTQVENKLGRNHPPARLRIPRKTACHGPQRTECCGVWPETLGGCYAWWALQRGTAPPLLPSSPSTPSVDREPAAGLACVSPGPIDIYAVFTISILLLQAFFALPLPSLMWNLSSLMVDLFTSLVRTCEASDSPQSPH